MRTKFIGTVLTLTLAVCTALLTVSPAHADPRSDVQQLQQQTSDLHANWDNLSPAERQQRLAQLSRQSTIVQNEADSLPPEQRPEVQLMLTQVTLELADLLRRSWPAP